MTCIWNADTRQWEGERYQWPKTTRLPVRYRVQMGLGNRAGARRRIKTRPDALKRSLRRRAR